MWCELLCSIRCSVFGLVRYFVLDVMDCGFMVVCLCVCPLWRFQVVCGSTGWCLAWRCELYSYGVWSGDVSCGMVLLGMWCVMWRKVKGDMVVLFGMVLCFVIGV